MPPTKADKAVKQSQYVLAVLVNKNNSNIVSDPLDAPTGITCENIRKKQQMNAWMPLLMERFKSSFVNASTDAGGGGQEYNKVVRDILECLTALCSISTGLYIKIIDININMSYSSDMWSPQHDKWSNHRQPWGGPIKNGLV